MSAELPSSRDSDTSKPLDRPIRLVIQQPTLTAYRTPVFRELARRPGIDLQLLYGTRAGLPNAAPDGFRAEPARLIERRLLGRLAFWHGAQWQGATQEHADVLMLTWNVRYASLVPSLLRAKAHGVATILWGHGYSKNERTWAAAARARVARLATALLFYNRTAAARYLDAGWDPRRIYVAPNSLDQASIESARKAWTASPDKLAAFRQQQGVGPGPLLLYVSRLDPQNRLDLLITAAARLAAQHPHLAVVAIGEGHAEQTRLEGLAREAGISQRVRFLGAIYDQMQLAPWFLSADVFCYPANIGLSLLHAFGYGLPVVTSDCIESQNPEIEALRDGENGVLYADGDAIALAAAIDRVVGDPDGARRMSASALKTVRDQFTLEKMVDGMEAAVRYGYEARSR